MRHADIEVTVMKKDILLTVPYKQEAGNAMQGTTQGGPGSAKRPRELVKKVGKRLCCVLQGAKDE